MAAPAPAVARLTATVIRIWVVISPAIFAVSSLRARPYQVILLMISLLFHFATPPNSMKGSARLCLMICTVWVSLIVFLVTSSASVAL